MPSTQESKAQRTVEVAIEEGLHMRPAMQFVDHASKFDCEITVSNGTQSVNGKSIMQLTMLAAAKGTELTITAVGPDAQQAVDKLASVVQNETTDNVG